MASNTNKPSRHHSAKASEGIERSSSGSGVRRFLTENKKWWLPPVVLTVLILILLFLFSHANTAPFVYSLF